MAKNSRNNKLIKATIKKFQALGRIVIVVPQNLIQRFKQLPSGLSKISTIGLVIATIGLVIATIGFSKDFITFFTEKIGTAERQYELPPETEKDIIKTIDERSERTNRIIIKQIIPTLNSIADFLNEEEVVRVSKIVGYPRRSILIKTKIGTVIEGTIQPSFFKKYSPPYLGVIAPSDKDYSAAIEELDERSVILSSPEIVTIEGKRAEIHIISKGIIPRSNNETEHKELEEMTQDLKLSIIPNVDKDDLIAMKIILTLGEKVLEKKIIAEAKERIILLVLLDKMKASVPFVLSVPLLGDIPLLGTLFRREVKLLPSALLISLSPDIEN